MSSVNLGSRQPSDSSQIPSLYERRIDPESGELVPSCVSSMRIPEPNLWGECEREIFKRLRDCLRPVDLEDCHSVVLPNTTDTITSVRFMYLFTTEGLYEVSVSDKEFDGYPLDILNYNNYWLFTWQLLQTYWEQSANGPMSYHAFWSSTVAKYRVTQGGRWSDVVWKRVRNLRQTMQDACIDFVILQQIDYSSSLGCHLCNGADGIILDGTKLYIQSTAASLDNPW